MVNLIAISIIFIYYFSKKKFQIYFAPFQTLSLAIDFKFVKIYSTLSNLILFINTFVVSREEEDLDCHRLWSCLVQTMLMPTLIAHQPMALCCLPSLQSLILFLCHLDPHCHLPPPNLILLAIDPCQFSRNQQWSIDTLLVPTPSRASIKLTKTKDKYGIHH